MNRKGQTMAIGVMSMIFVMVVGFMMLTFLLPSLETTRIDLNCAADDISSGTMLLCLATDLTIPYWIFIITSVALGFILARIYL